MFAILDGLVDNLWVVLVIFFFIWIYGWGKEALGSAKLGILFAVIVVYLTFYSYPFLVWLFVAFFLIQTFGKEFLSQINPFGGDQLR